MRNLGDKSAKFTHHVFLDKKLEREAMRWEKIRIFLLENSNVLVPIFSVFSRSSVLHFLESEIQGVLYSNMSTRSPKTWDSTSLAWLIFYKYTCCIFMLQAYCKKCLKFSWVNSENLKTVSMRNSYLLSKNHRFTYFLNFLELWNW